MKNHRIRRTAYTIAIWMFPCLAAILCGWLAFDYYQRLGPMIKITFPDASNVEAQKTPLRFRGITVGRVEKVVLSPTTKEVVVSARLSREAKKLAVEGAQFWIVQPQVDFEGIRGLETIFRGSYIRIEAGKGEPRLAFQGKTGDDVNDTTAGTITYILRSRITESINPGDSVTYRGLKVGAVSGVRLDRASQWVEIQVSIERQYGKLIRNNTVFWKKVGVQAKLGLFKSELKISSLESLIKGGIAFATPNEAEPRAKSYSRFILESGPPKDWEAWIPKL